MHLPAFVTAILLLGTGISTVSAAVHQYNEDYFYAVADAYIFRGGREGLYASSAEVRRVQSLTSWNFCCNQTAVLLL